MKTTLTLATLLLAPALFAADQSGRFEPGTPYEAPAAHAPKNVSRMFVKSVPRTAKGASVDVPAAGGSGMILWMIPAGGHSVAARVTTPSGAVLQPADRGSVERGLRRFRIDATETAELDLPRGAHEVVHVMETVPATYRVDLDLPRDAAGATVVAAEPDSAIVLSSWAAPLSRQPHQPVTLHAEVRDGENGISGLRVTARLASPSGTAFDTIALTDRGDGVYEATLAELPANVPGAWQVRFDAEGETAQGVRFARTGAGELVAERGAARLGAIRTLADGNALRVTAEVTVHIAGNYRFDVLAAANGMSLGWAEGVRQLEVGTTTLTIDLPLDAKPDLLDVRLLSLDTIGVADRVEWSAAALPH